jgi:hypothetical protein
MMPGWAAAVRRLDLDALGAHVGEHLAAHLPGHHLDVFGHR